MAKTGARRRLTVGAELQPGRGAAVRVWAPACATVDLVAPVPDGPERVVTLTREADGHFSGTDPEARPGARYWFRLDGERLRPDPVSRWQPDGPHGPSAYVDPAAYRWQDANWKGLSITGSHVIYEMHVGTFTREGTWRAAAAQLPELARIGITVIEMMPIADFPGRFGWGYDGVGQYAPVSLYGTPEDLRAFIDAAHGVRLGVILDVVYNHIGPDGNYLTEFSPDYFTDKYENDWGRALNFEGPPAVRAHFVQNGQYWIDEFHFDGLRLDATQDIRDASDEHLVADVVRAARVAAGHKSIIVVAENEPQDTRIVRSSAGGFGADALWNDDAHHTAVVALTGRREAYYCDYLGTPQELVSAARFGYLYQGQWYDWQEKRRGTSALDLQPRAFISYLENHDQVANSAFGLRLHQETAAARYRAMTAWLLLGPATPMLFQGQEFASSKPFLFFADHQGELAESVRRGRVEFLEQFPSTMDPGVKARLPVPSDPHTFERCILDFDERERHAEAYALHSSLLALRGTDPVLGRAGSLRPEGAVIGASAFLLRYLGGRDGDRLLLVNLGTDFEYGPVREPLLAPPAGCRWRLAWSSETPAYGGMGTPPVALDGPLTVPGTCALFFKAETDSGSDTRHRTSPRPRGRHQQRRRTPAEA